MARETLLVVLAHVDDELGAAGTILAQRARGDRVVVLYLTKGESTEAFGPLPPREVAARRQEMAKGAASILGVEHRFLDFPDGGVEVTPENTRAVARVLSEVQPTGLLTWGEAWVKGMRHPDHRATGRLAVDAVTVARIAKLVAPSAPYREACPVFSLRGVHSTLPSVAIDVADYRSGIFELADFYHREIGFGDGTWLEQRLRRAGAPFGLSHAEVFDAWETQPGVVSALLPAESSGPHAHPTRGGPILLPD
jgi:LmbE family N-acetylglucosaminyl deacetylase